MLEKNVSTIEKEKCFGCGACENVCQLNAIEMKYDEDGFLYPIINNNCVNCGKCLQVCQVTNNVKLFDVPRSYAVMNKDDNIRKISSSGGFFSAIAQYVLPVYWMYL